MRKLPWATLLLGVSMLTACGDDDVECGSGTVKRGGSCMVDYDGGFAGAAGMQGGTGGGSGSGGLQCGDGTVAVNGECVPIDAGGAAGEPATPAGLPVGAACDNAADCESL